MESFAGNLSGLICAFSPAGDAFAIASPDGRVKAYDTGNGQLRVSLGDTPSATTAPQRHALDANSCIAWVSDVAAPKGKVKKAGRAALALAVGTVAGDVKLYDTLLGELKWRTSSCIEGGVSAVIASLAGGVTVVLAVGPTHQVLALDVATGAVLSSFSMGKQAVTCLAISADRSHLFGGGSALSLWDVAAQERRAKFAGHAMPARAAAFSPDGLYIASAAPGERTLALWATATATKRPKKIHTASGTLDLEDPAVHVDMAAAPAAAAAAAPAATAGDGAMQVDGASSSQAFLVSAVSEVGEAYAWLCRPVLDEASGRTDMHSTALARIRVGAAPTAGSAPGLEQCVLAAKLQHGRTGPSLLVARGSSAGPAFQTVDLPMGTSPTATAVNGSAAIITLAPISGGLLLPDSQPTAGSSGRGGAAADGTAGSKRLIHRREDVTVVAAESAALPLQLRGGLTAAAAEQLPGGGSVAGRRRLDVGGTPAVETSPMEEDEVPEVDESYVSLEERVAALEEVALGLRPPGSLGDSGTPGTSGARGRDGDAAQLPAKADALATLLTQALRSDDLALLERVFQATGANHIIRNTVSRLLPVDAVALLQAVTDRLVARPARALQLTAWLRWTLLAHAGYLMSSPAASRALTTLFQAVEARCATGEVVLRLLGRLDLVNHHFKDVEGGDDEAAGDKGKAQVVFQDADDDLGAEDVDIVDDDELGGDDDAGGDIDGPDDDSGGWESADPDELDGEGAADDEEDEEEQADDA